MRIVEDTRQQAGKHANKHRAFKDAGVKIIRSKLPFGDYALAPTVAVDTKQDIKEIAGNMCGSAKEKARFREECKLAQDSGCRLIILIEDPRLTTPADLIGRKVLLHTGRLIDGTQLARAMAVTSERYGVEFMFCDPEQTGKMIMELLTNDN